MESEDNRIPMELARELAYIRNKISVQSNRAAFLYDCGLYSSHYNNSYYNFDESYLYIKDHRKWLLAKIKHGI